MASFVARVTSGGKKKKVKKIFTPRPGQDAADHECEQDEADRANAVKQENLPPWRRHFDADELFGRYEPTRELGRGSYGIVYEGVALKDVGRLSKGTRVAIKKVRRVFHTDIDAKRLLRELRILRILRNHDSLVRLYDILPPKEPKKFLALTLIFEFVDADLGKVFRTNQFFSELHVQYMLYQVLLGLKYMHSAQIVHRDLKPANILINEDCSIKVCDFGLARGFTEDPKDDPPIDEMKDVSNGASPQQATKSTSSDKGQTEDKPLTKSQKLRQQRKLVKPKKKNSDANNASTNSSSTKKVEAKGKGKPVDRAITRHVVTRWYRAPEVILLQQRKETLSAVDMWSVGCIFAELLQMQKENRPDPAKRGPLFPGDSCFPLSIKDSMDYASRVDQMQMIFDIIGSPIREEVERITDDKARKYLYNLPPKKARNLKQIFPGTSDDGLTLLKQLLTFDVKSRITCDEALDHTYFTEVRDKEHERFHKPVHFQFENVQLNAVTLRELILEEVLKFNKWEEARFIESGAMKHYAKMRARKLKQQQQQEQQRQQQAHMQAQQQAQQAQHQQAQQHQHQHQQHHQHQQQVNQQQGPPMMQREQNGAPPVGTAV